jgi:23S rRNA-/tRNA-specific pseudouridylate synthase
MLRRQLAFATAALQPWRGTVRPQSRILSSLPAVRGLYFEGRRRESVSATCLVYRPRAMCSSAAGKPHPLALPKADLARMTPREREQLRLRSKAIPLVADTDPLEIVYEDEAFLVVSKPQFVKMHPAHRFEGGTLVNRVIGYLNYNAHAAHR